MSYANPNVLPSGTTFPQFQQGGASGQLERLITTNAPGEANPTAAATLSATAGGTAGGQLAPGVYFVNFTETNGLGETTLSAEAGPVTVATQAAPSGTPTVVVSGTGGTLPAGVYRGKFTYVDANLNASGVHGETTPGSEFSFTQTNGAEPVITINDGGLPSWASGRNLYLTAPQRNHEHRGAGIHCDHRHDIHSHGHTARQYGVATAGQHDHDQYSQDHRVPCPPARQLRPQYLSDSTQRWVGKRSPVLPRVNGFDVYVCERGPGE
jgi:hypothetical protein